MIRSCRKQNKPIVIKQIPHICGEITVPGDKSIAHRGIILSAVTSGKTIIKNFPRSEDCLATLNSFRELGVKINLNSKTNILEVNGKGLNSLVKPKRPICINESGTTFRLLLGILAGCNFSTKLVAGKALSKRPMLRVTHPLRLMGAEIKGTIRPPYAIRHTHDAIQEEYPPITIKGGSLKPIKYKMPVASAQVKSAILFAGLFSDGITKVIEPVKTRDHTERMLKSFKAGIKVRGNGIILKGNKELSSPGVITVPGDISSASFFMVLAAIIPGSRIVLKNVSLNPTRAGIIKVLKRMQADIKIKTYSSKSAEPAGDIIVRTSRLKATVVRKEEIPALIDELPILMVAACNAEGSTVFEGVQELRVKETDRIRSMQENLKKMGALLRVSKSINSEKVIIEGKSNLSGAKVRSFRDHRTAMSMVIAGLKAKGKTSIDDVSCIKKSFPDFLKILKSIIP